MVVPVMVEVTAAATAVAVVAKLVVVVVVVVVVVAAVAVAAAVDLGVHFRPFTCHIYDAFTKAVSFFLQCSLLEQGQRPAL